MCVLRIYVARNIQGSIQNSKETDHEDKSVTSTSPGSSKQSCTYIGAFLIFTYACLLLHFCKF